MTTTIVQDISRFTDWAHTTRAAGRIPRIVVVGSVGKSTVARLVEAIAREAGLRTAIRTDDSLEILGRRRVSSQVVWDDVLALLRSGSLDLVVEEIAWTDLTRLGDATGIGMLIISTICPDKEVCRLDHTRAAISSLRALLLAMPHEIVTVADADDVAFSLIGEIDRRATAISALRPEQPGFKHHFSTGGRGAWVDNGWLMTGRGESRTPLGPISAFPLTLGGSSRFQVHNLMSAALALLELGIPVGNITEGLQRFRGAPDHLPHSLHLIDTGASRVVIDRPHPSWFLNPLLKTLRALKPDRVVCVADYPSSHPVDDLVEVGRLLSRLTHAFVLVDQDVGLPGVMGLRAGVAQSPQPPPIIHASSLRRAIQRARSGAGEDDLTLILTSRPHLVHRELARTRTAAVA